MSNTFFSSSVQFPSSTKVRLPKGAPSRVTLSVIDMANHYEDVPGYAEFEVVILDEGGYLESSVVRFSGHGRVREHNIQYLAPKTTAVYVLPLRATDPNQHYSVTATTTK